MKLDIEKVDLPRQFSGQKFVSVEDIKSSRMSSGATYQTLKTISTVMDDYYLDPLIGFFPVVGDVVSTLTSLPFIFVALFEIRSVPLTLAVTANVMKDSVIGMLPFWIGDILDFFVKANKQNYKLIVGYVEGDQEIKRQVNQTAKVSALIIGVLAFIGYWIGTWAISLGSWLWETVSSMF